MSRDSTSKMPVAAPEDPGLGPVDILVILGREKWLTVAGTLLFAIAGWVISSLIPPTFTGVARMLPPPSPQTTTAMVMGQSMGGASGFSSMLPGFRNTADLYVGLLKSDSVADVVVERFKLKDLYGTKFAVDTRARLAQQTHISAEKTGIITISVEAGVPKLAADLANAYVDALHQLSTTLVVSDAGQRRAYFGKQLELTKDKLAEAEVKLRQAMDAGGLVSVDVQGRSIVENMERLRAQITAREIQVNAMRSYAAPANPDLQRAEDELAAMRASLARAETGTQKMARDGADPRGLANIRLLREVKYQELLFEQLAKLYELARADEGKQAPLVQVLDRATPPERKSGPRRSRFVLVGAAFGLITATAYVLGRAALEVVRRNPTHQAQLDAIRSAWSLRKR